MVYGIIELINFAHGDIFMVGAFVALFDADRASSARRRRSRDALLVVLSPRWSPSS